MPLKHLVTWASTLSCAFTEPGLHITIPRRISSLFTPLTNAPNWSPACASSRIWWNISMPIAINVTITTFTDILRHTAIMVTMIIICWDVVTSQTTWCHIQEDLIFRVTPTNTLNQFAPPPPTPSLLLPLPPLPPPNYSCILYRYKPPSSVSSD